MSESISIDYDKVIMHLKQFCPVFEGRVRHAVDLVTGVSETNRFPPPAAYVGLSGMAFAENDEELGLVQVVDEQFTVWVEVDCANAIQGHRAGATGIQQIYKTIYPQLVKALLYWNPQPSRSNRPIELVGFENIDANPQRQIWAFDFKQTYWVTQEDGWEAPEYEWDGVDGFHIESSNAAIHTDSFQIDFDGDQQGGPVISKPTPNW